MLMADQRGEVALLELDKTTATRALLRIHLPAASGAAEVSTYKVVGHVVTHIIRPSDVRSLRL